MPKTATTVIVHGREGLRGTLVDADRARVGGEGRVVVRLDDGREVVVPAQILVARDDGTYFLPLGLADLTGVEIATARRDETTAVVPVVQEELEVHKRNVETGRVRVTKTVSEHEELVDTPLLREEVEVERVPVHRPVTGPVAVRQEGDTTIIPVVEEVLVVEKRLMLKEELRITKRRIEERHPQRVTLRQEKATVERIEGDAIPPNQ